MRKRLLIGLAILALLVVGVAAGAWVWNDRKTADVRGSASKEFETTEEPGTTTRPEEEIREEAWPLYGYNPARTRVAPEFEHRPPFTRAWRFGARRLLEFPPVIAYGRLYFANISGRFFALDAETGDLAWQKDFARFAAASPAVSNGVVYQPLMNKPERDRATAGGLLVAMDAETGDELWTFKTRVVESSPLVVDGRIYFGTFDNKLYALDAETGKVEWSLETGDDVKGGPALAKGRIYFASYDGKVYAANPRTGKKLWESSGQAGLGGAGNFYATPAVAYGRVFIGNTDGKVYAFGARSGDLLWSKSTGGFVYSSAAVFERTVYVGSYDGRLYALDAATGDVKWSVKAGERISGAVTVVGGIAYFATFGRKTFGVDAKSGKRVFTFPDGKYTPVVADEKHLYVVGARRLYALKPAS
jgi:outer membrane protein assembly factor BamB